MELLNVSVGGQAIVRSPIISFNCSGSKTDPPVNLTGSPFSISPANIFTAIGCNTRALMTDNPLQSLGCESTCHGGQNDVDWREMLHNLINEVSPRDYRIKGTCNGTGCCQITNIPSSLQVFNPSFQDIDSGNQSADGCKMAFLEGTYGMNSWKKKNPNIHFPMRLDWMVNSSLREDWGATGMKAILTFDAQVGYWSIGNSLWYSEVVQPYEEKKEHPTQKKFFKRNGGLLLQQQLTSSDGSVKKTQILTSKELEKATDRFNDNRILGQGGQGTVYKEC
ncbi:hypothetical protein GH714_027429 [Hevea brasiliensis]|uniref:Wall-associated receptor kinase domain-containing protein n=1 Tax=Hevea brasiliensis TaxID=3981 RepID=A0A6A6LPN6_HEVBR|nr:hypothetical protein GH714_027429 [Hevea brasiliensis]